MYLGCLYLFKVENSQLCDGALLEKSMKKPENSILLQQQLGFNYCAYFLISSLKYLSKYIEIPSESMLQGTQKIPTRLLSKDVPPGAIPTCSYLLGVGFNGGWGGLGGLPKAVGGSGQRILLMV